ncbi:MAG: hypothetical protein PHS62_02340 [Patescibacteria group bacterium]|nr:hypothetical protein [Patescibacteria group bacterium]
MSRKHFRIFFLFSFAVIFTLGLSLAFQSLLADWTAPLHNPPPAVPNCISGEPGCDAPLNAGNSVQAKQGSLWINTAGAANPGLWVTGSVGVGVINPAAKLQVQDGAVLFNGTSGTTPASGAGTRMMWIPAKAAFRVGAVTGSEWDDRYIGNNSIAIGYSTIASTTYATALGAFAAATGANATALGYGVSATGAGSTALGGGATASGISSTALGVYSLASGAYSMALGYNTTASGFSASTLGYSTIASGSYSVAFGSQTAASGSYSAAMGLGTKAESFTSLALGRYNVATGTAASWVATEPIFQIGIGTGDVSRADAMTVLKNGNVGIGIVNPGAKLEVAGQVKITGGTPGAGKVLTSDANGLAVWQALTASSDTLQSVTNRGTTTTNNLAINGQIFDHQANNDFYINSYDGLQLRINSDGAGSANLKVNNSANSTIVSVTDGGTVFFTGTNGTTPISGAGTRLMWIPGKKAFRAGSVDGSQWDDANIGDHSIAIGNSTTASGIYSTAFGFNSVASQSGAVALGGGNVTASGFFSTALGYRSTASAQYSLAMGYGVKAQSQRETVIGSYNIATGTPDNWVATEPIFEIGNGIGSSTPSNALTVLKNGNVGIGANAPIRPLQVGAPLLANNDLQFGFTPAISFRATEQISNAIADIPIIYGEGYWPSVVFKDTDAPQLATGLSTEVGGQLISFGTNFDQLGYHNDSYPLGYFRIDVRSGYENEFFSLNHTSGQLFGVTTGGNAWVKNKIRAGYGSYSSPAATLDISGTGYISGNVGIGTTNPNTKLEVVGIASSTGLQVNGAATIVASGIANNLKLDNVGGTSATGLSLANAGAIKGYWALAGHAGDFSASAVVGDTVFRSESNNILFNRGSGAASMAVVGNNVGIGTITPGARLDVNGLKLFDSTPTNAAATTKTGIIFGNNAAIPQGLVSEQVNTNGDILSFGINVPQVGTRDNSRTGGIFRLDTESTSGLQNGQQSFVVWGYPTGGASAYTRFIVSLQNGTTLLVPNGGNVGIGTTNPLGKLDVNGAIYQRGASLHADYVFEPGYSLESIDEHADFMWLNKHLRAVPVGVKDENGQDIVNWGERERGVLEELEKAHVYIQQLNERIKVLEAKVKQ